METGRPEIAGSAGHDAGQVSQVTQRAGLLDRVGLRLGPERFDLLLEQIDYVLGRLQPARRRCRLIARHGSQAAHQGFHSADAAMGQPWAVCGPSALAIRPNRAAAAKVAVASSSP